MGSVAGPRQAVDYDRIAVAYDERFDENARSGTQEALQAVVRALGEALGRVPCVLEVGCGTGKWLADLAAAGAQVYGLDLSAGMLDQAKRRRAAGPLAAWHLVRGRAGRLPFASASVDLVYTVNAIHHFGSPRGFVSEACRVLRPGGRLAVIGMDPHGRRESWYVYRYFEGVYETDLARFPSWHEIQGWMAEEGLSDISCQIVERIWNPLVGRAALDDPFIRQSSCSQLALLSEETYRAGLRRIEDALAQAEAMGQTLTFPVDTPLAMIVGQL